MITTILFLLHSTLTVIAVPPSPSPPPPIMPSAPPGFTCNNNCIGPNYISDGVCDDGGEGAEFSICGIGQDCMDCGVRYISPPPAQSPTLSPSPSNSWPPLPSNPLPNAPPLPGLPPLPADPLPNAPPLPGLPPSPPDSQTLSTPPSSMSTSDAVTPAVPPSSSPTSDKNYLYWLVPVLGLFLILNGYLLFLCIRKYYNDSSD